MGKINAAFAAINTFSALCFAALHDYLWAAFGDGLAVFFTICALKPKERK